MRIAVGELALRQQSARLLQRRDDGRIGIAGLAVGLQYALAGEQRHMRIERAVLGHRLRHLDAIRAAEFPVVGAMARRDVDESRALVGSDELAWQNRNRKVIAFAAERMGAV